MASLRSLARTVLRTPRQRLAVPRAFSSGLHLSQQFSVSPMNTAEYNAISNQTMDSLTDYLEELIETIAQDGYDVEYSSGVLTLALDTKGTFVINKQPPNKQIWLSSPISGPKRYDYDSEAKVWFYSRDDSTLKGLLDTELRSLLDNQSIDVDLGRNV